MKNRMVDGMMQKFIPKVRRCEDDDGRERVTKEEERVSI